MGKASNKIKITLVKSLSGLLPKQRKTAIALGLTKIGRVVEKPDTPVVQGMVKVIRHLVTVEG